MLAWLKRVFWKKVPAAMPAVRMQPHPVSTNPTPSERAVRNQERMKRLEVALEKATDPERRASLKAELKRRAETGR